MKSPDSISTFFEVSDEGLIVSPVQTTHGRICSEAPQARSCCDAYAHPYGLFLPNFGPIGQEGKGEGSEPAAPCPGSSPERR